MLEELQGCGLGIHIKVFATEVYIAPLTWVSELSFWFRGSLSS
jgi:hypothetical protein